MLLLRLQAAGLRLLEEAIARSVWAHVDRGLSAQLHLDLIGAEALSLEQVAGDEQDTQQADTTEDRQKNTDTLLAMIIVITATD